MSNTRILPHDFEYLRARSVQEAVSLLASHEAQAKVIAGGTDLLVQMKMERVAPDVLIDIRRVADLDYIVEDSDLQIGAITSIRNIERSGAIKKWYAALSEAASSFSSAQIKAMGTVGGNLCNASPAADLAPPLLAFDARIRMAGPEGERVLPLEEFFVGPGETTLAPCELLVEIRLSPPSANSGSAFLKVGRVAADIAKINIAAVVEKDGENCSSCRIALGSVAATPIRARKAEALFNGRRFTTDLVEEAAEKIADAIRPITDIRSSAEYRTDLARILVRDVITVAWQRAGG